MLIYSCLRNGQVLKQEVLEGIVRNDCDLMVITSESKEHSEENKSKNVKELIKHCPGDFIFIDSDVVMCDKNIISKINLALRYNPVVTIPTKPAHTKANFPDIMPHAICGVRRDHINYLIHFLNEPGCAYCNFLKVFPPTVIWNEQAYEITR